MFDIEKFKSSVVKHSGLMRNNKFIVRFVPPLMLSGFSSEFQDMELMCESTAIPGVNMITHDVRRYGYGPTEKRPTTHSFTDLSLNFLMTNDSFPYRMMHQWISIISPFNMNNGISNNDQGTAPFLLRYKSQYITDLRIKLFTGQGQSEDSSNQDNPYVGLELVYREAFPLAINEMSASWGLKNEHQRVGIVFSYTDSFIEPLGNSS